MLINQGRYEEAIQQAQEAASIATEIKGAGVGSYGNTSLARAYLYSGNLSGARDAAETALQYDEPENNHLVQAALGVIALLQEDRSTAHEAFTTAVFQTEGLLSYGAQNYSALDSKGLALSGLTLCDGVNRTSAAIEAYRAARAINKDAGNVARVLRLFDALAVVDSAGVLKDVRAAAAGE
jgi:tetratricopeptide (TPR) repeat protein